MRASMAQCVPRDVVAALASRNCVAGIPTSGCDDGGGDGASELSLGEELPVVNWGVYQSGNWYKGILCKGED